MGLFDRFKKNKKSDFQIAFEKNLKYISNLEKEVSDIERQFVKTENRFYLKVGEIDCPTGWIVVADPLAYLPNLEFSPVLEKRVPKGKYPVYVSLARSDEIDVRMCTIKMKIKKTKAVKYELANPTENTASFKASDGIVPGFPVDSGLVSICDEKVFRRAIMKSLEELKKQRDKLELQIFIAQTLAVSDGADLLVTDDDLDEEKKMLLNNVIRECIKEGAKE